MNPEHLEAVTQAVNVRRGKGTKLTETDVASIRDGYREGAKQDALAGAFGVTQGMISMIVSGQRWADTFKQAS